MHSAPSSWEKNYWTLKQNAAIGEMASWGTAEISGADGRDFLQRFLSNDVRKLQHGMGQESMILNATGKILAHFRIYALENSFLILSDTALLPKIEDLLEKYRFGEDVHFKRQTLFAPPLSIQGPQTFPWLRSLFPNSELPQTEHGIGESVWNGGPVTIVAADFSGCTGASLWFPLEQKENALPWIQEKASAAGIAWADSEVFEALRIETGVVRYGIDADDSFFPAEAGLENAYSLEKGCYVGQEAVAKMKTYGNPRKKIVRLQFQASAPIASRSKLFSAEETVGEITSWTYSPGSKTGLGLGWIKKGFYDESAALHLQNGERVKQAPLPERKT